MGTGPQFGGHGAPGGGQSCRGAVCGGRGRAGGEGREQSRLGGSSRVPTPRSIGAPSGTAPDPGDGQGLCGVWLQQLHRPHFCPSHTHSPVLKPFHRALQRAAPHGDAPGREAPVLGTPRGGSAASCSPLLPPGALGRSKPRVPRPPSRRAAGPRAGNVKHWAGTKTLPAPPVGFCFPWAVPERSPGGSEGPVLSSLSP